MLGLAVVSSHDMLPRCEIRRSYDGLEEEGQASQWQQGPMAYLLRVMNKSIIYFWRLTGFFHSSLLMRSWESCQCFQLQFLYWLKWNNDRVSHTELLWGLNLIIIIDTRASLVENKESDCKVGDLSLIPGLGRFPGGGHGNPFQYSCLENPMDRGAWHATVHRLTKSWIWPSD